MWSSCFAEVGVVPTGLVSGWGNAAAAAAVVVDRFVASDGLLAGRLGDYCVAAVIGECDGRCLIEVVALVVVVAEDRLASSRSQGLESLVSYRSVEHGGLRGEQLHMDQSLNLL